jgi:hypothetical protein
MLTAAQPGQCINNPLLYPDLYLGSVARPTRQASANRKLQR